MEDSLTAVEVDTPPPRRRYSVEFKRQVVQESFAPGASIARVAMAHGINANLLHTWRWQYRRDIASGVAGEAALVPVRLSPCASSPNASAGQGRIEVIFESARVVVDGNADGATLRHIFDLLRS